MVAAHINCGCGVSGYAEADASARVAQIASGFVSAGGDGSLVRQRRRDGDIARRVRGGGNRFRGPQRRLLLRNVVLARRGRVALVDVVFSIGAKVEMAFAFGSFVVRGRLL